LSAVAGAKESNGGNKQQVAGAKEGLPREDILASEPEERFSTAVTGRRELCPKPPPFPVRISNIPSGVAATNLIGRVGPTQ